MEKREEGLILINTLPLETYLCYVVPSEMPSSYPIEALSQAVCADVMPCFRWRTVAARNLVQIWMTAFLIRCIIILERRMLPCRQCSRLRMVIKEDGQIENTLYYSTSCGLRMEEEASNEAVFCAAMSGSRASDAECEESWYRWNTLFRQRN